MVPGFAEGGEGERLLDGGRVSTSIAALRSIEHVRGKLSRRVFQTILLRGSRGATCDELEHVLDLRHQTLSARVRELYLGGWIYRTTRRRLTRSKRQAIVYRARKERRPNTVCSCDRPTCSRFPCKVLREYRIAHRVVTELANTHDLSKVRSLLEHIECECEILVK